VKIVKKKLADLQKPERNVRMHTEKQLTEFRRSVEMFGQIRPLVIDEQNTILAGNGLYETLLSLGHVDADCYVVTGLTDAEKKKLMLADNRVFELGVDDLSAFDAILAELGDDLDIPGYDEDLLRSLTMDDEEITKVINGYGKIEPEQRERIDETRERYELQAESSENPDNSGSSAPHASAAAAGASDEYAEESTPTRRMIICPHCGESIWL
jgi:ParB-like chromosome segregation protein Spo0J